MKRLLDVVLAGLGVLLLAPLLAILAVLVRLSSPGPAIYRARRVGLHGKPFELLKFRSMRVEPLQGAAITRAGDPRVTRIGRILRAYKLDELPQLINVVRGDMSLVGPRPEDPKYTALYDGGQREILSYRPGITSAASLLYRDEESMLSGEDWEHTYVTKVMPAKLRIDLDYMRKRSVLSDFRLIFRTLASAAGGTRPRNGEVS